MPPKGSRGARGPRGPRGRITEQSRTPTPSVHGHPEEQSIEENTRTTMEAGTSQDTPMQDPPTLSVSAEASQDVSIQETPTLSPASIPTETPASTPAAQEPNRAPSQRLDSLAPRGRGQGRARGRGRAGAPFVGAAPPSFRPKAIRRDQSERQRAADEERKRVEERLREHEVSESRLARGRGQFRGGQRGRGDAMGKRMVTISTASGIFSSLPVANKDKKASGGIAQVPQASVLGLSGYEGYSNGEAVETTNRPKFDQNPNLQVGFSMGGTGSGGSGHGGSGGGSGGTSHGVKIKREVADPVYPGLEMEGQRAKGVNIEHINLVSDDENEDVELVSRSRKDKGRASGFGSGGLKPVRIMREEHKERVLVVNTAASSGIAAVKESGAEVDDDGLFVPQDLEAERRRKNKPGVISRDATGKPWAGVWSDSEDDLVQIKPEPVDVYEAVDVDNPLITEPPSNPSHVEEEPEIIKEGPSPRSKPRTGRVSGMRDSEAALQTDEDKAEWQRHQEDVAILSQELGGLHNTVRKLKTNADGDIEMEDEESEQVSDKEGRLYLFQFPPILPPLYNPNKIKEEEIENAEVSQIATKPAPGVSGSSTAPIDISKSANPTDVVIEGLKAEPDENAWKKDIQTAGDIIPEEGFIGKLIVRESGKVEMSWGGTSFELSRGAAHDFLMTTLLMDGLDEAAEGEDAGMRPKAAVGLGSVMGKFVVTPDWDKMFFD